MQLTFTIPSSPAHAAHRPHVRAGVAREFNSYTVPGVATVEAWPHRPIADARAIARRIASDLTYLHVAVAFRVPGVVALSTTRAA